MNASIYGAINRVKCLCKKNLRMNKDLSKKVTCLRGCVAEWPSGRVAKINFS